MSSSNSSSSQPSSSSSSYDDDNDSPGSSSSGDGGEVLVELPVFPLSTIAPLPTARIPLNIIEARYRVLFHTLVDGVRAASPESANEERATLVGPANHGVLGATPEGPNVDEGLVQVNSPFRGTARLGMCFFDKATGEMSATGTVVSVRQFDAADDGRTLVLCHGECRMSVVEVIAESPVLTCRVRVTDEGPMYPLDDADTARALGGDMENSLADEVRNLYRDTVSLGLDEKEVKRARAYGGGTGSLGSYDDDDEMPMILGGPALDRLTPATLAYYVASRFDSVDEKLVVLELPTVAERLGRVRDVLGGVSGYLRAERALKDAFPDADKGEKGEGDGGGGDDDDDN